MYRSIAAVLTALVLSAAPLAAQESPQSSDAVASVNVLARLVLTKAQDVAFGSHFRTAGVVLLNTVPGAAGVWNGEATAGDQLSVSFALPTQLARATGSGAVPFSCGITSANFFDQAVGTAQTFDPNGGLAASAALTGTAFQITLGNNGNVGAAHTCQVDLTGARPGLHTGTITLTVAVL